MSALLGLLALAIHAALMLAAALLLAGLIAFLPARLAGMAGPSPLAPARELRRLARKVPVLPESASPLFAAAPLVVLATSGLAALLVPSFTTGMLTGPDSDLLLLAGLSAVARAVLALAALDTGAAPGGMGASEAAGLVALAAPGVVLATLVLAGIGGSSNLELIAAALRDTAPRAPHLLAALSLALIALAVGPGDAAMRREYSGRHLAALVLANALLRVAWLTLIALVACPFGLATAGAGLPAWLLGAVIWAAKLAVLGIGLGAAEVACERFSPAHRRGLLGFAMLLGMVGAALLFAGLGSV